MLNVDAIVDLIVEAQPLMLTFIGNLIGAIAIFVVGRWLARLAKRLVKKIMTKAQVEPTLTVFATNILFYGIMAFVVLASLGKIGIQTTSLVAAIGAAGLAIGLALQGSLTNFAAGIIIIIFQPLRVGDWIEVKNHSGIVTDIQLLTTILCTHDNRTIIVPNGEITEDSLMNYSTQGKLRLDLVVGVDYSVDIDRVKAIFMDVVTAEKRVLTDPVPFVGLLEMGDSSLNFAVRPWVQTQDYLTLQMTLQEDIKKRLDIEGINIPFPQRDVHLFTAKGAAKGTEATARAN